MGRIDEERATLDELVLTIREHESPGDTQNWHVHLILALVGCGRSDEAGEIVRRLIDGPWKRACLAVLDADFAGAADILAATGERPLQAELRLLAAKALAAEGRHVEAAEQLEQARAFWTSVGATVHLREADELFAEAS
jgi:hypothetical protein